MSRGYAAIGLDNPKSAVNVGSVMRAALVYDAALVVVSGGRVGKLLSNPTDTMKAWKHLPVFSPEDILTAIPHDCVPVAVDLVPGARSLYNYAHPERAFYIFGGEDQTLGKRIISKCRDVVMIPTERCMNLAACVNVVLYDRAQKAARKGNGI